MSSEGNNQIINRMTPTEFEVYCKEILVGYAEEEGLRDFSITHNERIKTRDGDYQIDVYAEATFVRTKIKFLCECKRYSSPVKRDVVMVLKQKLEEIGAHKGIILSTSGFQSGAIEFANKHGIALAQMFDGKEVFYSYAGPEDEVDEYEPFGFMKANEPKIIAVCYFPDRKNPVRIYPTRTMMEQRRRKIVELTKKVYGIDLESNDEKAIKR